MTEPTTAAPEAEPVAPEAPAADVQPEPDGQFDAQRAMEKIQKANREAEGLRKRVKELEPQAEQFHRLEEASKSEAQRLAEAAEAAKRDADDARAEAIRYKAAATHGIGSEHFDLLGSGTEEEITARAAKIQTMLAAQATPAGTPAPTARPLEQLRPGATPGETDNEDAVLMARLFGAPR